MDVGPGAATWLVSDNILVTKLSPREAARGYLVRLNASRYSPRYIEERVIPTVSEPCPPSWTSCGILFGEDSG